jgi:sugar lactone lactonase YvrE
MAATGAYEVFDDRFRPLASGDAVVERIYSDCRWAEGPVYVPAGRYLLWSDVSNDRMLRWDEVTGSVGSFREPSGYAMATPWTAPVAWSPASRATGGSRAPSTTARSR